MKKAREESQLHNVEKKEKCRSEGERKEIHRNLKTAELNHPGGGYGGDLE